MYFLRILKAIIFLALILSPFLILTGVPLNAKISDLMNLLYTFTNFIARSCSLVIGKLSVEARDFRVLFFRIFSILNFSPKILISSFAVWLASDQDFPQDIAVVGRSLLIEGSHFVLT